jgi:signal transduction histidine kinase/CheY-like chemotaxis protein
MTVKKKAHTLTHIRIFVVIIVTAIIILASGLAVGVVFQRHSISLALEDNMLVCVDIANEFVSHEITLLKRCASDAAREIRLSSVVNKEVLEHINAGFPKFIGMALFDETGLRDYSGISVSPDLINERFIRMAFDGRQSLSTTIHNPDGKLVMYISAPAGNGMVLISALPGLYLSERVSQFVFWDSGHLFIDDAEGTVIANIRSQWVEQRMNFIMEAKTDPSRLGLSKMVERGISGERGIAHFEVNGIPRICAFRPITGSSEGWFLGIIAPLNESALKDIPLGITLIGSIMLVLSIISAAIAARILKRPYEEVDHLRRVAEIASISKSTFLANMSHEIRTPMNSVMGFSELALDNEVPPKIRDYLIKIRTNSEWLLQIINDVLDISKIESGKMELESIPFDMHEVFSACRTLIMPKAIEKGLTMHFYAEPSFGKRPLGDPTRLRQVFLNLLSNAIKFTNTGMIKLHSAIKNVGANNITVYFEIKDSGIGMTSEQINRIFDPFVQAESGTVRKYGGTGLGLTITRDIVELMGGELFVESTPGIGSKFYFELTFNTIDVDDAYTNKKIIFHDLEKPTFEGEVLLCEDNIMNQQVIHEHLARVGLKTIVAENGQIGVDIIKNRILRGEKQFDLIFMDMHMPVMDGLEAAAIILELNLGIPIVAMTANIMSSDREMYKLSGMSDCVGKPFTSQELWQCLMKYFKPLNWKKEDVIQQENSEKVLRQNLINSFVKNNQNFFVRITSALNEGDTKLAHRLAHTLKSNAGQLNKTSLQKAAENVENLLKDGKNIVTPKQMAALEKELNVVLAELKPQVSEQPRPVMTEQLNREQMRELLDKLEPMLEEGNPESLKLLNILRTVPGSGKLVQQIEAFDFDIAIHTIAELKKEVFQ